MERPAAGAAGDAAGGTPLECAVGDAVGRAVLEAWALGARGPTPRGGARPR